MWIVQFHWLIFQSTLYFWRTSWMTLSFTIIWMEKIKTSLYLHEIYAIYLPVNKIACFMNHFCLVCMLADWDGEPQPLPGIVTMKQALCKGKIMIVKFGVLWPWQQTRTSIHIHVSDVTVQDSSWVFGGHRASDTKPALHCNLMWVISSMAAALWIQYHQQLGISALCNNLMMISV